MVANGHEKIKYYRDCVISPRPGNRYELMQDFIYKDEIVPKGYVTNGANIPRILWSIWPPNKSDYLPAVVMHDWLADKEEYAKAQEYFEEMLNILEVNKFTVWCFVTFTTLYFKIKYKY